jgi:hypothetical protein
VSVGNARWNVSTRRWQLNNRCGVPALLFSFDRAQIPIQPIESLLDELVPGYDVPALKDGMALMFFWGFREDDTLGFANSQWDSRNRSGHLSIKVGIVTLGAKFI